MDTINITMTTLEDFNEQSFEFRIPALAFLGFMLPFGILGNASVIYIYGFRLNRSNVYLFITLLAVSDITNCLVGIPLEMYRLYFYYNYHSKAACKIEAFVTIMCYICSMLILLTISAERYVKVCRSTKTQVSRKVAKVLTGAVFLISALLAIPFLVFTHPHPYTLENGVIVHICAFSIEQELWYYSNVFFVVLLVVLAVMFVLYWRVLKTVKERVMRNIQRKAQSPRIDTIDIMSEELTKLRRTNRTVIWLSVVYTASCVPVSIVSIVTKLLTHYKVPNPLDFLFFVLFQSWVLNCTLNPIVYGFFNKEFRSEFHNLLTVIYARVIVLRLESNASITTESTGTV